MRYLGGSFSAVRTLAKLLDCLTIGNVGDTFLASSLNLASYLEYSIAALSLRF